MGFSRAINLIIPEKHWPWQKSKETVHWAKINNFFPSQVKREFRLQGESTIIQCYALKAILAQNSLEWLILSFKISHQLSNSLPNYRSFLCQLKKVMFEHLKIYLCYLYIIMYNKLCIIYNTYIWYKCAHIYATII